MTAQDKYTDIFQSHATAHTVIDDLELTVYANGLLHVNVPKYYSIDLLVYKKAQEWINTLGPEKSYHFIFEFASFAEVDPEMRKHRATEKGTNFSLSDALVISNFPQKMLGDFYLRINRPSRPTKVFYSVEKAVEWSLKLQAQSEKA